MTKHIDIAQQAVDLANAKMARRFKTCECKMPYRWLKPYVNLDGQIRIRLEREGWSFHGFFTCDPGGKRLPGRQPSLQEMTEMVMVWNDDEGCDVDIYGSATVNFVLRNLLESVPKQRLGLQPQGEE